jgi:hypothetical protein
VIPGAAPALVTESGVPLSQAPGVRLLGRRPSGCAVAVGSGSYSFVARPRTARESKQKRS